MRLGNPNAGQRAGGGRGRTAPAPDAAAVTAGRSNQAQREWFRPWPATGEFDWSLRNNTNYGETGVLTALQYTSQFPKVILENFYMKSRNSVETGRKETVAGYVIPAGQRDMTRVERLVNLLRMQGIEVGRATAEVQADRKARSPPARSSIKRDQPYGRLAKTLLEKQVYPDPNLRTYDDASWTMGLMSHDGREGDRRQEGARRRGRAGQGDGDPSRRHAAPEPDRSFAVAHYGSNNMITLRYRLKDLKVQAAEKEFKQGDAHVPAGSFVVSGDAAQQCRPAVEALGLTAVALPGGAAGADARSRSAAHRGLQHVGQHAGRRLGALRVRQFEVPYDLIYKERVRKGDLQERRTT